MKEKYNHIDKKFTNHAWGEMQKLLDKEIPVTDAANRKRRRWFLIFLFFGLTIGIGSSMWALGYFEKEPKVEKTKHPIALDTKSASIEMEADKVVDKANLAAPNNSLTQETSLEKGKELNVEKAIINKALANRSIGQNSKEDNSKVNNSSASSSLERSANPLEKIVENVENESFNRDNEIALSIHTIDSPSISLFEISEENITPLFHENSAETKKKKKKKFMPNEFAVFAGGIAGIERDFLVGGKAGINLSYHLPKQRWAIETGINYSYLKNDFNSNNRSLFNSGTAPETAEDYSPVLVIEEILLDENNGSTSISGTTELLNNANLSIAQPALHLHYLNVPVSVSWKASPKWSFYSGAKISALLSASSKNSTGGVLNSRSLGSAFTYQYKTEENSLTRILPVRKYDFSTHVGFRYHFSKSFSMDLQYNHGFRDMIKYNFQKDYNRSFQFSLFYNIKKKDKM